jgi:hypothetical protein
MRQEQSDEKKAVIGALAESLGKSVGASPCPDEDTLADWADGTLRGAARQGVLDHITRCRTCAAVAAGLLNAYGPVRALHAGWLGWRGAVLLALGSLPKDQWTGHAFEKHQERCGRCRWRSTALARVRGAALAVFPQPHALWRVVATAVLLAVAFPGWVSVLDQAGAGRQVTSYQGREKGTGSPVAAAIRELVSPTAADAGGQIEHWERALRDDPTSLLAMAALVRLYEGEAERASGQERRSWELTRDDMIERLATTLSAREPGQAWR